MSQASQLLSFSSEMLVATYARGGELVHQNDAWRKIIGPPDQPWSHLSDEQDQTFVQEYLEEALTGSMVTNQVFMADVRGHDEPVPVLLHFLPVNLPDAGDELTVQAVLVNGEVLAEPTTWMPSQTKHRRLEMLGRMAIGVTHDFNNLLSSILGYTELLKNTLPDKDPASDENPREYLRTIEQAASDGASLIDRIQQYIRQEKEEHFERLQIPELIEDCIALTRPYWFNEPRRKSISIEIETEFDDVPPVVGSESAIREVFVNLILNAVQAMPDGGLIRFKTSYKPKRGVIVQVEDTGVGMPDKVQQRIFEPMFTTRGEEGTGMGLTVSSGIIQEHDGTITVSSTPGEGTCFTICFPEASATETTEPKAEHAITGGTGRILIVDDEQMICDVLDRLLSKQGHTVKLADSAEQALEVLEDDAFDVLLTDLGLPGMNGRELARHVRDMHPNMPVVLITGHTERGKADQYVDAVIDKPFKVRKVEEAISRLLPGN